MNKFLLVSILGVLLVFKGNGYMNGYTKRFPDVNKIILLDLQGTTFILLKEKSFKDQIYFISADNIEYMQADEDTDIEIQSKGKVNLGWGLLN